jgi:hypothetical protein
MPQGFLTVYAGGASGTVIVNDQGHGKPRHHLKTSANSPTNGLPDNCTSGLTPASLRGHARGHPARRSTIGPRRCRSWSCR